MKGVKDDLFTKVNAMQTEMTEQMNELSSKLVAVEKYMWRQNVLQGMREQEARKRRQGRVRLSSPEKCRLNTPQDTGASSRHQHLTLSPEAGGMSTAELKRYEELQGEEQGLD
jgi:hypothetical protein